MSTKIAQVLVSVPTRALARKMSVALLEAGTCACVQTLGPVESRYVWKGRLETAREYWVVVKTRASRAGAVEALVRTMHPYEVPEILVLPVAGGSGAYLAWIDRVTSPRESSGRRRAASSVRARSS